MKVCVDGMLGVGVVGKDVVLHIIKVIGTAGGTGSVVEFCGSVIERLSMEARMSICNMSIEAGARAGMIAPDEITFSYLKGRPLAPKGKMWEQSVAYWRTLCSDSGAHFDEVVNIDANDIKPTVTWYKLLIKGEHHHKMLSKLLVKFHLQTIMPTLHAAKVSRTV